MARLEVGFIPIEGGHYYREALEEVTRAEELGFDSVWMEEHHSVTDHYWPSPLPVLAGFATRTTRMRLGTDILVAPFYHPVRLAEDAAMLDVMSNGRFVLGIAIGYKPDEFALYGAALEKRGARFEEQLAIMKALWTRSRCAFQGPTTRSSGRLEPKSDHAPASAGLDRRLGRHHPAPRGHPGRQLDPGADRGPAAACSRASSSFWPIGRRPDGPSRSPSGRSPATSSSPTPTGEARELAEKHIMISYRKEYAGGWRHPFIDASIATDLDRLMKNRFIIGGPEQVIARSGPSSTATA